MIRDIVVNVLFATFGTIIISIFMGVGMWFVPWLYVPVVFLVGFGIGILFFWYLEEILQAMGYKYQEERA